MSSPPRPRAVRLTACDRLLAWAVTGPAGRLVAFVCDLTVAWWRCAQGRLRDRLRRVRRPATRPRRPPDSL